MRIQRFFAIVAACFAMVSIPPAAHAAAKPCDLFSPQSASSILGTPVKLTLATDEYCFYQSNTENENIGMTLSSAAGATPATLNSLVTKGDTSEAIPGLGDQNLLISKSKDTYTLVVFYHGQVVSLTATKRSPATKAALITAMRQIMGKI